MGSVFSMLHTGENDLTAALGWTLQNSTRLREALLTALDPAPTDPTISIDLEVSDRRGRTDLERHGRRLRLIIKAERGWQLPTVEQLAAYAPRVRELPVAHLVAV